MNWEQDDTFLARWLSGELSEEERIVFEESPEGKEYIKMMNASDMIQPPSYDVNKELSKLKSTIAQEKPVEPKVVRMRPLVRLAVAASVLVILSLSIFLFTGSESFETDILQQEFVALPDGSEVQLNSSSTLAFNKRNFEDERELDLKGEAFFEVKKGVKFTVTTDNGAVEVLGTSFNVNSREERLEVICYTGKVRVSASHVVKVLQKGDRLLVKNGELIFFGQSDIINQPSWMDGIIELDNVTLEEALIELNANYGIEVAVDDTYKELLYTGSMPKNDIETALKLTFDPLRLAYTFDESSNTVKVTGQID